MLGININKATRPIVVKLQRFARIDQISEVLSEK